MRPYPPVTNRHRPAFTLIEMLVVIAIIGLMAAAGLPALKGFGKANSIAAAQRQMLDELNGARQHAIAEHTQVFVLFTSPSVKNQLNLNSFTAAQAQQVSNILKEQFSGYALYVQRSVGDQPGRPNGRYLTRWRSLPDGMFIRTNKFNFNTLNTDPANDYVSPFKTNSFPFPTATNAYIAMAYLEFDHLGQLVAPQDNGSEVIPLAQGFVEYGNLTDPLQVTTVQETPAGNSRTNSTTMNRIRIDGLTGRARVEQYSVR